MQKILFIKMDTLNLRILHLNIILLMKLRKIQKMTINYLKMVAYKLKKELSYKISILKLSQERLMLLLDQVDLVKQLYLICSFEFMTPKKDKFIWMDKILQIWNLKAFENIFPWFHKMVSCLMIQSYLILNTVIKMQLWMK
jgi:hypothetical protein